MMAIINARFPQAAIFSESWEARFPGGMVGPPVDPPAESPDDPP